MPFLPQKAVNAGTVVLRRYNVDWETRVRGKLRKAIVSTQNMSHKYRARIYVTLRPSVLDPAGTAVESGLKQMGYEGVDSVRIGKYVELNLTAASEAEAKQQLDLMCDRLLANTVIENYRFEITEFATA